MMYQLCGVSVGDLCLIGRDSISIGIMRCAELVLGLCQACLFAGVWDQVACTLSGVRLILIWSQYLFSATHCNLFFQSLFPHGTSVYCPWSWILWSGLDLSNVNISSTVALL